MGSGKIFDVFQMSEYSYWSNTTTLSSNEDSNRKSFQRTVSAQVISIGISDYFCGSYDIHLLLCSHSPIDVPLNLSGTYPLAAERGPMGPSYDIHMYDLLFT